MKKSKYLHFIIALLFISFSKAGQASNEPIDVFKKNSFFLIENTETVNALMLHDEVIGTFVFERYSSELLLLTASLEKKHFVHALKKEEKCSPEEMISVCGNKYLREHLEVKINDQLVQLTPESSSVDKDFIVLTYSVPTAGVAIKHIKVTSDYMFKYNKHSILKVIFELSGRARIFNIRNKRRTINAKFKNLK